MSSGQILPAKTLSALEFLDAEDNSSDTDTNPDNTAPLFDYEVGGGVRLSPVPSDIDEGVLVEESDEDSSDDEQTGGVMIKEFFTEKPSKETIPFPSYGMSLFFLLPL